MKPYWPLSNVTPTRMIASGAYIAGRNKTAYTLCVAKRMKTCYTASNGGENNAETKTTE